MIDLEILELVRTVFIEFEKTAKSNLSKKQILKTLYLVKMDLPDENPLKEKLAYYWYLQGPTSNVIYSVIEHMKDSDMVRRSGYKNSEMYKLAVDIPQNITHDKYMSQALQLITKHVDSFINVRDMVADVYARYSPFEFYTTYNLDFKKRFENYCNDVLHYNFDHTLIRDEILDIFDTALLDIPAKKEFFEFELACNDYSKSLHVLLMTNLTFDEHIKDDYVSARDLCDEIWTTFAYTARLYAHDHHYEQSMPNWKSQCDKTMKHLNANMKKFSDSVDRLPVPEENLSEEAEAIMKDLDDGKMPSSGNTVQEYRKIIENLSR